MHYSVRNILYLISNFTEFCSWGSDWQYLSIGSELIMTQFPDAYIDGLVPDCSNSSALAMELLQSCTKPSICLGAVVWCRILGASRFGYERPGVFWYQPSVLCGIHGDIMTWKHFPHCLPFNLTVTVGFPPQRASNAEVDVLFVVSLNKLFKKCILMHKHHKSQNSIICKSYNPWYSCFYLVYFI